MRTVNIHEAKTQLSRLLADVARGEEVLIARNGRPVARLVPVATATTRRQPGLDRGKIEYADDVEEPLADDVIDSFEA